MSNLIKTFEQKIKSNLINSQWGDPYRNDLTEFPSMLNTHPIPFLVGQKGPTFIATLPGPFVTLAREGEGFSRNGMDHCDMLMSQRHDVHMSRTLCDDVLVWRQKSVAKSPTSYRVLP